MRERADVESLLLGIEVSAVGLYNLAGDLQMRREQIHCVAGGNLMERRGGFDEFKHAAM